MIILIWATLDTKYHSYFNAQGKYSDFSINWFSNIADIWILVIIYNIFLIPLKIFVKEIILK